MSKKHYIVGAGRVGCLYDYGPNFHETRADAIQDAVWYVDGTDDESISDLEIVLMCEHLKTEGIHYFSAQARLVFGDYVQVSAHNGPCPEDEG